MIFPLYQAKCKKKMFLLIKKIKNVLEKILIIKGYLLLVRDVTWCMSVRMIRRSSGSRFFLFALCDLTDGIAIIHTNIILAINSKFLNFELQKQVFILYCNGCVIYFYTVSKNSEL